MKTYLVLVTGGVGVMLLGFVLLFGAIGRAFPPWAASAGFTLMFVGPLTVVGGLVVYALQRPTPKDLAGQRVGEFGTWHFRPRGLLILAAALAAFLAIGFWAERYIPGINSGDKPPSAYIFAGVCVALLSSRKVRDQIFYTGSIPDAAEGKSAPAVEPGESPERDRA